MRVRTDDGLKERLGWQWWGICALLIGCYLAMRLPRLREVPMFCDEATYARWAQVILQDPPHQLWVSMEDAKPPMHAWLLAVTRWFSKDPILAARLLSVFAGAAMIPFLLLLCAEIARIRRTDEERGRGLVLGVIATALMISSPLLAIHQRMGIAESLLLTEGVVIAWLSLRWARRIASGVEGRALTREAVVMGVCWGVMLLTKQAFSYLMWIMPAGAMLAWMDLGSWRETARRFGWRYLLATAIGAAMFVPVLFTSSALPLMTRLFYKPGFYPKHGRVAQAISNIVMMLSPRADGHAQWWPHDPAHPLDDGWLYVYLTPPVFVLAIAGLLWMWRRRVWGTMLFLGVWVAALLGVLTIVGGSLWSRYMMLGVLPLLLIVAWLTTDLLAAWRRQLSAPAFAGVAVAALLGVFAWPTWAVSWNVRDWSAPVLTASDRGQYLTRQCAGPAAEEAMRWFAQRASRGPMVVVTGYGIGLPNDMVWLALQDKPNVQTYWDNQFPPLQPVHPKTDMYLLGRDRWGSSTREPTELPANEPIFMLVPRIRDDASGITEEIVHWKDLPGHARPVKVFLNPPGQDGSVLQLVVLEVPPRERRVAKKDAPGETETAMLR